MNRSDLEGKTGRKTFAERLAEEIAKVPDDKREIVGALLLGTCQGVQIGYEIQQRAMA